MSSVVRSSTIVLVAAAFCFVIFSMPSASNGQTNACVDLTRTLRLGSTDATTNGEVTKLQQYLTQTGDYTYGSITGYFGPATEAAVKRFQCRMGVVCEGTAVGTGYGVVGARTRAAMRCQAGGSDGVSLTASPTSVASGGTVTLRWAAGTRFDTCSITANGTSIAQNQPTTGTFTHNPTVNTTYLISCRPFAQGAPTTASAYVTVTPGGNAAQCVQLQRYLYLGHTDATTNGEVTKLQGMLEKVGLYTATINGTFDAATETAVKRFQCAKNIVCTGNADTTGYGSVGPSTRAALYSSCRAGEMIGEGHIQCPQDAFQCPNGSWVGRTGPQCTFQCSGGTATSTGPTIHSFDGPSTLRAYESGRWTVNASGSDALTYKINWGDGMTSGPLFSNSFLHSFSSNGTFTVEAIVADLDAREARARRTVVVGTGSDTPPGGSVALSANPSTIRSGESTTLSWRAPIATTGTVTCKLSANGREIASDLSHTGSRTVSPAASTLYIMDCVTPFGTISGFVFVTVSNTTTNYQCTQEAMRCPDGTYVGRIASTCQFAACPGNGDLGGGTMRLVASPSTVATGQSVTLSWVPPQFTVGTASCKLYANDSQIGGTFTTQASYTHTPGSSTTYRITCTDNVLRAYSGTVYVTVTGGNTSTRLEASPMQGVAPLLVTMRAVNVGTSGKYYMQYGDGQEGLICDQDSSGVSRCGTNWSGSHTYATPGTYTASLLFAPTCAAGVGCSTVLQTVGTATITVTSGNGSLPTISLTATPTSVASGQMVTLSWTRSSNSNWTIGACTITANGTTIASNRNMPGSMTHNPTSVTTYGIQCTGSGPSGSTAFTASATVGVTGGVDPYTSFNFTATPSSVTAGQTVTLRVGKDTTKNDVYIPSCSFTANGVTLSALTMDAGGNIVTTAHAPQVTTTYVASCQMNSGGYATETRTVTVTPASGGSQISLSANPTRVSAGQTVTLTYTVPTQHACFLRANGTLIASYVTGTGTKTHNPTVSTSYEMLCNSATLGTSVSATAYVTVGPFGMNTPAGANLAAVAVAVEDLVRKLNEYLKANGL